MRSVKTIDILLVIIFFVFSWWLMNKSFVYDVSSYTFKIARHQVGDFGLHIGLIRSFVWGDNIPAESPFFPGKPLPYHFLTDFITSLMVRTGVRIDIAYNGLSAAAFTVILYLIYSFPRVIFKQGRGIGLISVVLFVFHSSATFLDFFKNRAISVGTLKELWRLPDYIHKGPFDGSLISIYFTLNVFLNQRHLIVGMAIGLALLMYICSVIFEKKSPSKASLCTFGLIVGVLLRIHSLIFLSVCIVMVLLVLLYKRKDLALPLFVPLAFMAGLLTPENFFLRLGQTGTWFEPGFLAHKPLTALGFLHFWFVNTGLTAMVLPLGILLANRRQKLFFLCILPLFVLPNLFRLSFRIEHNHSMLNFFMVFVGFFEATALAWFYKKGVLGKSVAVVLLFLLTASGFIDLMPIKNDFLYPVVDAPKNTFIQWVKDDTSKDAVFLAKQELYDPVVLAGRRNYFGHTYYTSVMGYDLTARGLKTKRFFESKGTDAFSEMRLENISYIALPVSNVSDFPYVIQEHIWDNLPQVFSNDTVTVYRL